MCFCVCARVFFFPVSVLLIKKLSAGGVRLGFCRIWLVRATPTAAAELNTLQPETTHANTGKKANISVNPGNKFIFLTPSAA